MQYELVIQPHESNPWEFFSIAQEDGGGKRYGEARYWRTQLSRMGVWKARVDVKDIRSLRGQGIGTAILQYGDKYIHDRFPSDFRLFCDLNAYSYVAYTANISDEQIIEYVNGDLLFRP